jgi:plasmid stabilization system protein ParE
VSCTVIPSRQALREIDQRDAWWRSNRPAATHLFREELEHAVLLLKRFPFAGPVFRKDPLGKARRLLLPKSRHFVYYDHYPDRALVLILSVRSTSRQEPVLLRLKP